jgi:hypothetical protein
MRPGRGFDHLLPFGADAKEKTGMYCTSTPSLCLHGIIYGELHFVPVYKAVTQEKITGKVAKTFVVLGCRCRKWSPSVSYMQIYGEWQK